MRMLFINQDMYVIQSVVFMSQLCSLMSLQYMMMNTVVVTLRESIFLYMCEYIIHSNLHIHQVVISTSWLSLNGCHKSTTDISCY